MLFVVRCFSFDDASRLLDGRKEAQDVLSEEIERDMVLIGATAIEG
jgi:hypothetical protein